VDVNLYVHVEGLCSSIQMESYMSLAGQYKIRLHVPYVKQYALLQIQNTVKTVLSVTVLSGNFGYLANLQR
jgi:hypothetical protein